MLLRNLQSKVVHGLVTRRLLIVATTFLIVMSVMMVWANAKVGWLRSLPARAVAEPPAASPQRNQRPAIPAPDSMSVDTVTLTGLGFEPREITRPSGMFVLGIDNRLINEQFSFELVRENGHQGRQLKMKKGEIRLRKLLNLQAGSYTLTVADHPEWTCRIVLSD
jgi:hypothetical protein